MLRMPNLCRVFHLLLVIFDGFGPVTAVMTGGIGVRAAGTVASGRLANNVSNLAFLCLEHHDQYDSKTRQSKGFTEAEVKLYREELFTTLPSLLNIERQRVSTSGDAPTTGGAAAPVGKQYEIYSKLWQRLVNFRIAAHDLVDWLQDRVPQDPQGTYINTLNAYLAVVRSNEPFIIAPILEPARVIVSHGRAIAAATRYLAKLDEQRDKCRDWAADEQIAEKMIAADQERQEAVKEIDRLFGEVRNAIQNRMTANSPPG